jgi:hypothetical protein
MTTSRLVAANLIRLYRPVVLWFWATMIVCVAVGMTAVAMATDPTFSLWLLIAGSAAKYWLGVVGATLVSLNLRQFVANGVTRHEFLAGGAIFGLPAVALFALVVVAGHGVEQLLLGLGGPLPADYPTTSLGTGLREFGQALPAQLAFLVSGAAITAGFYRFGAWGGLALLPVALLPVGAAETLFGFDESLGAEVRFVPYAAAVLITLAVTALGVLLYQRELRDVTIRPATA